jgi:hypothetical protein
MVKVEPILNEEDKKKIQYICLNKLPFKIHKLKMLLFTMVVFLVA